MHPLVISEVASAEHLAVCFSLGDVLWFLRYDARVAYVVVTKFSSKRISRLLTYRALVFRHANAS